MMKPGFQSKILTSILRIINFKKIVEKRASDAVSASGKESIPTGIQRSFQIRRATVGTTNTVSFESKKGATKNHIIFLHGGAYIFEATRHHRRLAKNIVKKSFCRMTLVDYPLAPEHHYKQTISALNSTYENLTRLYPEDHFILMGDSAGGGLAMAFTQKLIKDKHPKPPVKLVLLSPWLDLSLSNPNIKNQENRDHILSITMLKNAALKYSNGDNKNQYLLSPINGDLKNLPETIVFYGTEELFYPDCKKLKSMTDSCENKMIFKEYQHMQHDWAIFPIPESKQVISDICKFI